MIIHDDDLDAFSSDLISRCLTSRRDRVSTYNGFEHYFLFGAQEGDTAPYGKIYPHLDLLTAYLYSQSTVEFDLEVKNQPDDVVEQAALIAGRLNTYFHDCGVAGMFSEALTWALVFNSTFLKLNWNRGELEPYMIEPHNFGVLREDIPFLNRQEAFVHAYHISKPELKRRVEVLPNGADIMRRIVAKPGPSEDVLPQQLQRMIVAGTVNFTTTTTRGQLNMPDLLQTLRYQPQSMEDLVEMYELWAWDDKTEDYRTITVAEPGVVIYGRKEIGNVMGIKGQHPFVHVCPNRLYKYFFGWSEITGLIKLQDWTSERLRDIRKLLNLQADPPLAASGFGGITDEKLAAFNNPGSWLSDPTPNAKVERFAPDVSDDMFQDLHMIQAMFDDVSGLPQTLQGRGESGVRSKGHADTLARLGSARIKKRALSIESTIEEIGGKTVSLMRAKDPHRYILPNGQKFTAAQFTEDYTAKVDAHSASPVFVDDHQQLAFMLAKFGAVDQTSLLELTKPPRVELLKKRQKENQERRAQQVQQMVASGAMNAKKGLKAV